MSETVPPVTIGMPVYNAERFVEQAIRSLLAQTHGDFALVISDNASTDGTGATCHALAAADSRISCIRQEANHGSSWNFNFLARTARSPLFMWAASDDLWEPQFLETCIRQLKNEEGLVLSFTAFRAISRLGEPLGDPIVPHEGVSSRRAADRVEAILREKSHQYQAIYGVIRRQNLLKTRMMRPVWAPEVGLLLELLFQGPLAISPEILHSKRVYEN